MALSDAELLELFSDLLGDDLLSAMADVRRDLLEEGEPPELVARMFARLCVVLNVDPVRLRSTMN